MGRHQPDPNRFGIFVLWCKALKNRPYVLVHEDGFAVVTAEDVGDAVQFELHFTETDTSLFQAWWYGLIQVAWTEAIQTSSDSPVQEVRNLIESIHARVTYERMERPPEEVFRTHLSGAMLRYCLNNLPETERMFHELERAFKPS